MNRKRATSLMLLLLSAALLGCAGKRLRVPGDRWPTPSSAIRLVNYEQAGDDLVFASIVEEAGGVPMLPPETPPTTLRAVEAPRLETPPPSPACSDGYQIAWGDRLEIKFRNVAELNEIVTVRPDGFISLQIVGDVLAAGRTPEDLRQELMIRYAEDLKSSELVVLVQSSSGNSIYVGGEVLSPARVAMSGDLTLLQAVITAGGFKETADLKRVIVKHADGRCCEYNLQAAIENCDPRHDVPLQPHDVVYVPRSCIAKVNLWVDQYINRVLPFDRSFGVFLTNTPSTGGVVAP
ncbi:MAG: polysaccharide biosynthesis/export family protein [Pirellulaceae bacterium]